MKRPDWEPMPGRIFDFTERQQILVEAIEKITGAEVVIQMREHIPTLKNWRKPSVLIPGLWQRQ